MACSKTVTKRNLRIALPMPSFEEQKFDYYALRDYGYSSVRELYENQPILNESLKIQCAFNFFEPCTLSGLLNLFKK